MDILVVILSIIAGFVVACGRGSLLLDDDGSADHHEQPIGRQIICVAIAAVLLYVVYYRLKAIEPATPTFTGALIIAAISMIITSLILWRTGAGGEPMLVISKDKDVPLNELFNVRGKGNTPEFHDPELDELIESGKLSEARLYLEDQLELSREMGDLDTHRKYSTYGKRLRQAEIGKPK